MFFALFDIITIGIPFCVFKLVSGHYYNQKWLVLLGAVDLIINFVNATVIVIKKKKKYDSCFLAFVTRKILHHKHKERTKLQELGESFDVALSFMLVAYVIGIGDITKFSSELIVPWNYAVVLNVLGAGSARVASSIQKLK